MKLIEILQAKPCGPSGRLRRVALYECPACGKQSVLIYPSKSKTCRTCLGVSQRLTKEEFMDRLTKIYGDIYNLDKVEYTTMQHKITLHCRTHGDFSLLPSNALKGANCPKCARCSTTREFIRKATLIHGDLYDYSPVDYLFAKELVRIVCKKHGEFLQTPDAHLAGKGCSKCGTENNHKWHVYSTEPCKLYVIYLPDFDVYKVGITNQTIAGRYSNDDVRYEIIYTKEYSSGIEAFAVEQGVLNDLKQFKVREQTILRGGNTELVSKIPDDISAYIDGIYTKVLHVIEERRSKLLTEIAPVK